MRFPPYGVSRDRPPVSPNPDFPAQPELFGSPLGVALGAEAVDLAVLVRSAMGQRHNVVRYSRLADNPGGSAVPAERFDPEPKKTLGNCASASKPPHLILCIIIDRPRPAVY